MDLATRLRTARESKAPGPLRELLRDKILEFQRTGRTYMVTQTPGGRPEKRVFTDSRLLTLTLANVSKGSGEVYVAISDGRDRPLTYTLGNIAYQFNVGETTIDIVTNLESDVV